MIPIALTGCAGTSYVGADGRKAETYLTAYLVTDEKEGKVLAGMQKALLRHGLTVFVTSTEARSPTALSVKYSANWTWDLVMYLQKLDVQFYDGGTGQLLMSATWKNGLLHGYQDPDDVTEEIVAGAMKKLAGDQSK